MMRSQKVVKALSGILCFGASVGLSGCGQSSNFNKIWGGDDEASDSLLLEAKAAYDRGDFNRSESLTQKLLDRNPDNEAAAVILGYTYLSLGGIDPYRLARELVAMSAKKAEGQTSGSLTADSTDSCGEKNATNTLQELGGLINLSADHFETLSSGAFDKDDNGGQEPELFDSDNPLLVPAQVTDDLRVQIPVLDYMNKAVKTVCRFVNDGTDGGGVKVGDDRDSATECAPTSMNRQNTAKAHFLWAFSHLTEALVYQSVLTYSSAASAESGCKAKKSNFQTASDGLNSGDFTGDNGFLDFIDQVSEMKNAVNAVYDTSSDTSMIRATLMSLNAVSKAFGEIAGMPDSIKERITSAFDKLNKIGETIGGGGIEGNTKALKGEMTSKMATVVGKKVDTVIADKYPDTSYEEIEDLPDTTSEQQTEIKAQFEKMCGAYDKLAVGLPEDKVTRPDSCAGAPVGG